MEALRERTIVSTLPREVDGAPGKFFEGVEMLLLRPEAPPDAKWIAVQVDPRYRSHAASRWWAAMLLKGGVALAPEPLIRYVREPTY